MNRLPTVKGRRTCEVFFDGRSAANSRTTGWERYTRSLRAILEESPAVKIGSRPSQNVMRRVADDWLSVPMSSRSARVAHYPTFPPTALNRIDHSIITVHDLTWWKYPETASRMGKIYYRPIMDFAIRKAALIATVSDSMAAEIQDYFSVSNICVIPNTVTIDSVKPEIIPTRERPYLLSVGTIEPRKNLRMLADAFKASGLSRTHDLLVVGREGWGQLPDGIVFTGAINDGMLRSVYESAQALVVPSLYEGFGLPIAEAIALGVPVYCSDIPVFREVAGVKARYFDPSDQDDIIRLLISATELQLCDRPKPMNLYTRQATAIKLSDAYAVLGITL